MTDTSTRSRLVAAVAQFLRAENGATPEARMAVVDAAVFPLRFCDTDAAAAELGGVLTDVLDGRRTDEDVLTEIAFLELQIGNAPPPPPEPPPEENGAARPFQRVALDLRSPPKPPRMLLDGWMYAGRLHVLQSEPDAGKTWLALWLAHLVMQAGSSVVYIDEEGGPELITERLVALGVDADLADERFHYFAFEARPWSLPDLGALDDLIASIPTLGLAVLDSLPDFLAAADLSEDSAKDVTKFVNRVCRRFREAGVAQLVLDHLPKPSNDTKAKRSRYGRGSGAKLAKADVTLLLEVSEEYDVRTSGRLSMWRTKDRRGRLSLPRLGKPALPLAITTGEGRMAITELEPGAPQRDPSSWDGPTHCMDAVREFLRDHPGEEFSKTQLPLKMRAAGHQFRDQTVVLAAETLAAKDEIKHRRGSRGSDLYRFDRQRGLDWEPLAEED